MSSPTTKRLMGFRPKRGCHDAIEGLFRKLSQRRFKQWVIEGDISGCFDNISHDHILRTLQDWKTPTYIRTGIERMLKSKIFEGETLIDPETGTPQGGILSPMLANVALTALDDYCERYEEHSNPIVRYADDFVVVCKTKEEAERIRDEIAEMLKERIGLTLSEEKTTITNIHDGIDFLGFNIRKYRQRSPRDKYHEVGKLLITPQKEKVVEHLRGIKQMLKQNKTARQDSIVHLLNPKLQGFAMYYHKTKSLVSLANRFGVSQAVYSTIDNSKWNMLWHWAKRRHPNKRKNWIRRKYFTTYDRKWQFKTQAGETVINVSKIPITRFVKIKSGMRVHNGDKETIEYWKKREYTNALNQVYSVKIEKLFKRQKGMCIYCGQPITNTEIEKGTMHVHHLVPRSQGGTEKLNDLRLVHKDCHTEAVSLWRR